MNRTSICTLFALITLLVGTAVGQNATEQEIAKLEQQFNGAYAKNDLEPYFSFYAPDAIQWLPEGRTDLATYKRDWTAYISAGNRVEAADLLELQVKVSPGGDAASAASFFMCERNWRAVRSQMSSSRKQMCGSSLHRDGKLLPCTTRPSRRNKRLLFRERRFLTVLAIGIQARFSDLQSFDVPALQNVFADDFIDMFG